MSRTFKKVDHDQVLDLTVRLGDCLPPDHLVCFVLDSVASRHCMPTMGNRMPLKYCWTCCSMAMRLACSVRARLSARAMRRYPFVSSQVTYIPTMIHSRRFGAPLPKLKEGPVMAISTTSRTRSRTFRENSATVTASYLFCSLPRVASSL